jgi:hypothetical protein
VHRWAIKHKGGGQIPYLVRRPQPGHGANTAQQLAGRKPQLAAAYPLHAAPPPGQLVPRLAPVLPEPSALHAQPVRRAPRQKPPRSDDRPRPSTLVDVARPRTTSAFASLTRRRSIASSTRQPSNRNPPSGPPRVGFRWPCVIPKWPILNHAASCADHRQTAQLRRCQAGDMPGVEHRQHKGLHNRAENSHRPTPRRERIMKRFKSPGHAQRFLSTDDQIANVFSRRPNQDTAAKFHTACNQAFTTWAEATSVVMAAW